MAGTVRIARRHAVRPDLKALARLALLVVLLTALVVVTGVTMPWRWALAWTACAATAARLLLVFVAQTVQWRCAVKASLDRIAAATLLLLLLPVLLTLVLWIWHDSPGPVVFRQRRHGLNGREFYILKFRTMHWPSESAASSSGAQQTTRNDPRVTRAGCFLRRTSLDELPQLLNVLNGTMSLVGPRPHPVAMRTERMLGEEIAADYQQRHQVKPGITGWAQVQGHRGATETRAQLRQRLDCDLYYIEHWSLLLDLRILVVTPLALLLHRSHAF